MEKKIILAVTTTPNRDTVFQKWYEAYKKFSPELLLYIYTDTKYSGIANAKNKCIKLLMENGATNLFLFDDDTLIKQKGWWKPYVESNINHMSFTFNRKVLFKNEGYVVYEKPCGCMLYVKRKCVETIGGFDTDFIGYAGEHQDFSQRIYNAGLTPYPFMDLPNSLDLFHSMDYHHEVSSSLSNSDKLKGIEHNMPLLEQKKFSKEFKPYK